VNPVKLVVLVVVLAVLIVAGHDGLRVAKANSDARNAASAAASAAAASITTNHNATKARAAADAAAKRSGDVVSRFAYDPVSARVSVTVSGSTTTWIASRFDKSIADNITGSATARPAG
jgi:hypothetical protein